MDASSVRGLVAVIGSSSENGYSDLLSLKYRRRLPKEWLAPTRLFVGFLFLQLLRQVPDAAVVRSLLVSWLDATTARANSPGMDAAHWGALLLLTICVTLLEHRLAWTSGLRQLQKVRRASMGFDTAVVQALARVGPATFIQTLVAWWPSLVRLLKMNIVIFFR